MYGIEGSFPSSTECQAVEFGYQLLHYIDVLFVISTDVQQDIHSQICSSKNGKYFSAHWSLKASTFLGFLHILLKHMIIPGFYIANSRCLIQRGSISVGQHFFFLSLAFWGFWDTGPIDIFCYALNFKKRYRQIFRGVVFHYLHICGHFLSENFALLKTTFLNLMNSPSIGRIRGAVQTNSKLYDNVSSLM